MDFTKNLHNYSYSNVREDTIIVSNKFGDDKNRYEPFMNDQALEIMKIQSASVSYLQSFIYNHSNITSSVPDDWNVLLINRRKTRKFINIEEMKSTCEGLVGSERLKLVYLEDYAFEFQIEMFSKSRIFVSVTGAGVSNIIFLPRGSVLILALPLEIFGHKYLYSNIALASGIHVIVMRPPEVIDINYGWDPKIDNFSLTGSQNDDVLISSAQFGKVMLKAIALVNKNQNEANPSFFIYPDLYDDGK